MEHQQDKLIKDLNDTVLKKLQFDKEQRNINDTKKRLEEQQNKLDLLKRQNEKQREQLLKRLNSTLASGGVSDLSDDDLTLKEYLKKTPSLDSSLTSNESKTELASESAAKLASHLLAAAPADANDDVDAAAGVQKKKKAKIDIDVIERVVDVENRNKKVK